MIKRFLCTLVVISLLLTVCGCGNLNPVGENTVTFYYRRTEYQYHSEESVIVAESREFSGRKDDLHYLLTLYLMGPLDEALSSPLPRQARVISVSRMDQQILLTLSDLDQSLTDPQFSLACACLALTCLELSEDESVTITSGQRSITIDRDDLLLYDSVTTATDSVEETQ